MPPFALTDPLWWVARWAARLLASLAVAGALTVGSLAPFGALHAQASTESPSRTGAWACDCAPAFGGAPDSPVVTVAHVSAAPQSTAEAAGPPTAAPAGHGATPAAFVLVAPVPAAVTVAATEAEPQRNAIPTVRAPRAPPGA
ncbi:hypothetical protein ABZ814_18050 [Micromonospora musae]|uniref:hypothetical protein n=1 Tax=Micromonospora musae TaxID=1894970 RepID=UPI0033EE0AE9